MDEKNVARGKRGVSAQIDLHRGSKPTQLRLIFARQVMGRPYLAPPGVPKDRADALRKAFADTMKDPEFLADAEKAQLEITPVDGATIQKLVAEVYQTPPEVAKKAAELLNAK